MTGKLTWSAGDEPLWAVVSEDGAADASHHRARVQLFAGSAGSERLLKEEEFPWAHLDRFADIDKDGAVELVFQVFTGGNCWTCSYVQAWTVRKGVTSIIPAESFQSLEDVDGDGALEALSLDTRWESYGGLCHACSPRIERICKRAGDGWVDVSATQPARYRQALDALETRLEQEDIGGATSWDDMRMGTLISILLHRLVLGEGEAGWREFLARVDRWKGSIVSSSTEQRAHIDEIVAWLLRDLGRR